MFAGQLWRACMTALRQHVFYEAYHKAFEVIEANTDALRERVYRLRHQVWSEGARILDAPNPQADLFDSHAIHHLLIYRTTGETAGVVRVVLPREHEPLDSFPLQTLCDHPLLQMRERVRNLCEISQMCVAPKFRRRQEDGRTLPGYTDQDYVDVPVLGKMVRVRRLIPYAPLGLFRAAFETALKHKIPDCLMLVEPDQIHSLTRAGLSWRVLGPRLHRHSAWQPMICNVKNALDSMRARNPPCWEVVSDRGRLDEMATRLQENDWQDRIFDESCREMIYKKLK